MSPAKSTTSINICTFCGATKSAASSDAPSYAINVSRALTAGVMKFLKHYESIDHKQWLGFQKWIRSNGRSFLLQQWISSIAVADKKEKCDFRWSQEAWVRVTSKLLKIHYFRRIVMKLERKREKTLRDIEREERLPVGKNKGQKHLVSMKKLCRESFV